MKGIMRSIDNSQFIKRSMSKSLKIDCLSESTATMETQIGSQPVNYDSYVRASCAFVLREIHGQVPRQVPLVLRQLLYDIARLALTDRKLTRLGIPKVAKYLVVVQQAVRV